MLSVLLDAATNPTSTHHATITAFLETRLAERQRSLSLRREPAKPTKPRRPPAVPRPGTIPLLVNVTPPPSPADPDPAPVYATPSRPRPQSELGGTGRRKVPRLDMAGDLPFLRLTKPQPPLLSRVLGQKIKRRAERMRDVMAFTDEALPEAQLEDQWDRAMAGLVREEKGAASLSPPRRLWQQNVGPDWQDRHDVGAGSGRDERSHAFALYQHGVVPLFSALSRERTDSVARADAMRRLIHQEKDLAAREKAQRAADKRARWEARMLELHGEGWRDLFPNLKKSEGRKSLPVERWDNKIPSKR